VVVILLLDDLLSLTVIVLSSWHLLLKVRLILITHLRLLTLPFSHLFLSFPKFLNIHSFFGIGALFFIPVIFVKNLIVLLLLHLLIINKDNIKFFLA